MILEKPISAFFADEVFNFCGLTKHKQSVVGLFSAIKEPVGVMDVDAAIDAGCLGSISGPVKPDAISPTACYRCHVSLELCYPAVKPRKWPPPFVTCFCVMRFFSI